MAVDTKAAPRRRLCYESFEDFERDVDAIERAAKEGRLRTTGNWTPGQVMEHCAKFANCAIDGFPSRAPWPVRKIIILMYKKKMLSGEPMPAGYRIPKQAPFLLPGEGVSTEEGIAQLRGLFARLHAGERFEKPSPIFEKLSHEQWCTSQLGHASMHMSFLAIDDGGTPAEDDWQNPIGGEDSGDDDDDDGGRSDG